jgi:hypothetical protein
MNNLITVAHATSYRAQIPSSAFAPITRSQPPSAPEAPSPIAQVRPQPLSPADLRELSLLPPAAAPQSAYETICSPLCNSIGSAGYIHSSGATGFVWCTVRLVASVESVTAFRDFATIFREKSWPSISSAAVWACSRDLSAAWVGRKNL